MPVVERMTFKLLALAATITAGLLARKAVTTAWKVGAGSPPPSNPEHPDVTWVEAIGWTVASGAAVGVARMLASRQMAKSWRNATGHLPPGTREIA